MEKSDPNEFRAGDVEIDQMANVLIIADFGADIVKKHIQVEEAPLKLADIEGLVAKHGDLTCCIITVLVEYPLYGSVYTYGNHGQYWQETGTLKGYA